MTLTPMMKQYLQTKEEYKDCILFYRLGDFYEMFFDDALTASKILDLVLTGRECGLKERAPMCGIPYHAADSYIAKLIEANYKVAICEQLTPADASKGLVERGVVKIITPGTVMDEAIIKEDKNNFIASVHIGEKNIGVAWADITTGEFFLTETLIDKEYAKLSDVLLSIMPSEIISSKEIFLQSKDIKAVKFDMLPNFSCYYDWAYAYDAANNLLKKQLQVSSLKAYECDNKKSAISAAGALIEYLSETQKRSLSHINKIIFIKDNKYMTLDNNTKRNLELIKTLRDGKKYGSLLWLLDKTSTSMGARNLYSWVEKPLNDITEIEQRLDGVTELKNDIIMRDSIKEALSSIRDIERLAAKVAYGSVNPKDCVSIKNTLKQLPFIKNCLSNAKSQILLKSYSEIHILDDVVSLLEKALTDNPPQVLKDGGIIRQGFNGELDEIKQASINGKKWLAHLEASEREKTGIKTLKIGFNRVFGYYIEVSKSYVDDVPINYIRKQTLANAERYITTELKEMEEKILGADEKSVNLEIKLFNDIVSKIFLEIKSMQSTAKSLATIDTLIALAEVAIKNNYCRPAISDSNKLFITEGRHPVVEAFSKNEQFVPNDTFLDDADNRIMIITGPNMAGKSTYMRQVALITLMAHIGSYVPASKAEVPLTDRIFTRVGATDNLAFDQSTFMVEMTEVANILHNATANSLLILDEVGRGTSTFDGLSIAWSVTEYIAKSLKSKTMFATHYHELTELEGSLEGVKNYRIAIKELSNNIIFLRKIVRGGANKSFGIEVAALAGLPKQVLDRSRKILQQLEEADINNSKNKAAQVSIDFENPHTNDNFQKYKSFFQYICSIDINTISPIEAINLLSEIISKAESID